ncbi:hypothetical protein HK098_007690 [Nowakowskiella sp. JEL0407]|nr:hypothetical protein HK098_007690 [Nowakowskiella sp. JEL0407]
MSEKSVIIELLETNNHLKFTCLKSSHTAKSFLLEFPRGVYTAARTLANSSRILDFHAHSERLLNSLRLCCFKETDLPTQIQSCVVSSNSVHDEKEATEVTDALKTWRYASGVLEGLVLELIRTGLKEYFVNILGKSEDEAMTIMHQNYLLDSESGILENTDLEAKVTILITYDFKQKKPRLIAHIDKLIVPTFPQINVSIFGLPREKASVKDSNWVSARAKLEKCMPVGVGEVILCDPHGNIYEGLTSNFCVLMKSSEGGYFVKTAPLDVVLQGTILKIVEAACMELGIGFVYEFPNVCELNDGLWIQPFITSTTRLALPVNVVEVQGTQIDSPKREINAMFAKILNATKKEVLARSFEIFKNPQ